MVCGCSLLQYNQLSSVGDEVKQILVKAESWVATRDGPISKYSQTVIFV